MTYKQIEATREVRLWITQVVVPIATVAITTGIAIPEVRQAVVAKCKSVKDSINKKLKKKEKKERDILGNELNDNMFHIYNEETGEYRMGRIRRF